MNQAINQLQQSLESDKNIDHNIVHPTVHIKGPMSTHGNAYSSMNSP